MTVQNATPQASSKLGPRGPLTLKILGGMRDGQLVRLNSPKCTVGSDRHCTFRLRGEGILPLHCLIIRGRQTTVIRRWSSDTTVNGHSFLDAPLSVGDRLSVGPVQLEIVSDEGPIEARTEDTVDQQTVEVRRQGRRRASGLITELRRVRQRAIELEATIDEQSDAVHEAEVVAEETAAQFARQQERWHAQQQTAEADRRFAQDELEQHVSELETAIAEQANKVQAAAVVAEETAAQFAGQQAQWHAQQQTAEADRRVAQDEFEQHAAELQAREESLQQQIAKLEADRDASATAAATLDDVERRERSLREDFEQLADEKQHNQEEQKRFDDQRADRQREADQRASDLDAELRSHHSDLETQRAAADADRTKMAQDRTQWEAERLEASAAHEAALDDLRQQQAALEAVQQRVDSESEAESLERHQQRDFHEAELTARQELLEDQYAEQQTALESQREELKSSQEELQRQQQDIQEQREAWQSQQENAAAELTARQELLEDQYAEQRTALESQREELKSSQEELQRQQQDLQEQREAWQSQQDDAAMEIRDSLRLVQQQDTELKEREEALRKQTDQLATERDELARKTSETEVPQEDNEALAQREAELADKEGQLAEQIAELESKWQVRRVELDNDRDDVNHERQALAQQREQWQSEQQSTEAELERLWHQLDEEKAALAAGTAEVADQQPRPSDPQEIVAVLDEEETVTTEPIVESTDGDSPTTDENPTADRNQVEVEPAFSTPTAEAPVSTQDVLAQFQSMQQEEYDEDDSDPFDPISDKGTSLPAVPVGQTDIAPVGLDDEEDEESVEDYMARLLERVRGPEEETTECESDKNLPATQLSGDVAESTTTESSAEENIATSEPSDEGTEEESPRLLRLGEMKPRTVAPELSSDIASMRKLAGSAASTAISTHATRRRWARAAVGKLAVAICGLVAGTLILTWLDRDNLIAFAGGVIGLLVAVFWGLQFGLLVRNARQAASLTDWRTVAEEYEDRETDNSDA